MDSNHLLRISGLAAAIVLLAGASLTLRGTGGPAAAAASYDVASKMAPYYAQASAQVNNYWLVGDNLGNYLYGSQAQTILHATGSAGTGDTTGRAAVDCGSIPRDGLAVIVIAGQSNSSNSASPDANGQDYQPAHTFYNYNIGDGKCYVAKEPVLGADWADSVRESFAVPLADDLLASGVYKNVLLVPVSVSGTYIEQWIPDANHFYATRITAALNGLKVLSLSPTFFLWHQGEGNSGELIHSDTPDGTPIAITPDVSMAAELSYMRNFLSIVSAMRQSGMTAPVLPALATQCGASLVSPEIRGAQALLPDPSWGIYPGPDTDALPFTLRRPEDNCHFSYDGMLVHADRWYNSIKEYLITQALPSGTYAIISADYPDLPAPPPTNIHVHWASSGMASCVLSWSYADGSPGGSAPVAANASATGATGVGKTMTYGIACQTGAGAAYKDAVTIRVGQEQANLPTATVSAAPNPVRSGQGSLVSWKTSFASSCVMNYAFGTAKGLFGFTPNVLIAGTSTPGTDSITYTVSCQNVFGLPQTASATVNVTASPANITYSNTGDPMQGSPILSKGTGFTANDRAYLGGVQVPVTHLDASLQNSLVIVPSTLAPGAYNLTIVNEYGTSNAISLRVHTPTAPPKVTGADTGDAWPGETFHIYGSGFTDWNWVLIGGMPIGPYNGTGGTITITLPVDFPLGSYQFTVNNSNGQSNALDLRVRARP